MSGAVRVLSVLLMLGLVLPACVKALGTSPAAAAGYAESQSSGGDAVPADIPCLTCCGNWLAMMPAVSAPDSRRDDAVLASHKDGKPDAEVWSAIAGGDPPPEWPLALASPHSYAHMLARTSKLLF